MPTIQKRQPRLKESCDCCSAAKVRCTKDKPNCLRCAQKGYECTYSHSRRAGRRNMNASRSSNPVNITGQSRAPSSDASSWPESHPSPEFSDDNSSDIFDLWNGPPAPTSAPDFPMLQQMWDEEMYGLQQNQFHQHAPMPFMPATHLLPEAPMVGSPQPFHAMAACPSFDDLPADLLAAPQLTRASSNGTLSTQDSSSRGSMSSVSSQHADAVHDELTNLTSFAEMMEKKFDGVVKTRLQYRDVYSEFGIPLDELESGVAGVEKKISQQQGFVPAPDASELAFYYSLAEMKRRLRWLKEDFGKMVNGQSV